MSRFDGYRARWREADHEAAPDALDDGVHLHLYADAPREGFDEVGERYVRVVPAAECETVYWQTVCTWQGHPFRVLEERGDDLRLEYTGGRSPVAARLGLERIERGVHRQWVPRLDVRDLHVETIPLLGGVPEGR